MPERRSTRAGPGRVLIAVYAVFAVSASARAGVQIATDFSAAPVAYVLSAFAAAVYVVATISLASATSRSRSVAWLSVGTEMVGVVLVGAISLALPEVFPEATVWSTFGAGYGFVPLVLPILGLAWLWRTRRPKVTADADTLPTDRR